MKLSKTFAVLLLASVTPLLLAGCRTTVVQPVRTVSVPAHHDDHHNDDHHPPPPDHHDDFHHDHH